MTRKWSVVLLHGIPQVIPVMDDIVRERCPGVEVVNILHEGIFLEISRAGGTTPQVVRRICCLAVEAENYGASAVLVTGSTFSPSVDTARNLVSIPVLKIDEAMAEAGVTRGRKIGLIATENATLEPSTRILQETAEAKNLKVEIVPKACPEARGFLRTDPERHDRLVVEASLALALEVDVVILAQSSLYGAMEKLEDVCPVPVYASPGLAADSLKKTLEGLGWKPTA